MAARQTWRNAALGLAAIAVAVAGGAWIKRGDIALNVFRKAVSRNLTGDPIAQLPDGLHVGLCGTGSPLPDPTRNGPCTAVIAGQRMFVVDAGDGAAKGLTLMGLSPARAEALLLTHFHSDHIDGLGGVMLQHWGAGASKTPLTVLGPAGVESVVQGFVGAYTLDRGYRVAHHGPTVMPPEGFGAVARPFPAPPPGGELVLVEDKDLRVTAFSVNHAPVEPAVGYKFVYKGRSVVISGDTAPSPNVEAAARGADLLVHEGLAPNLVGIQRDAAEKAGRTNLARVFHDIPGYHTSPEDAARLAQRAGVKMLVFTHIVPALPMKPLEKAFLGKAPSLYKGRLAVGHDGDFVSLPAGGEQITLTNRSAMSR